jgi:hypothetical protein
VARAVVGLPKSAQAVLAADVPDLEVYGGIWGRERDGSDVLADGGDGFEVGVRGRVGGFYLFEERGFSGVVEAEEEDRVLCGVLARVMGWRFERRRGMYRGRGKGWSTFFACGVEIEGFEEVVHCLGERRWYRWVYMVGWWR